MNAPSLNNPASRAAPDSETGPASALPSMLPEDLTQDPVHEPLWRQLGADHARAALVQLQTLQVLHARWMRDGGVTAGRGDAPVLDHLLPGADRLLPEWAQRGEPGSSGVVAHMLSPRRWVYFWRVDDQRGLLVLVHFLAGRNSPHEFDTAGIRVLCEHWLGPELGLLVAADRQAQPWNRVERRRAAPQGLGRRVALAGLAAAGLFGLWLAVFGASAMSERLDSHQRAQARLVALSNNSLHLHLSHALAGTDYGQVQEVLALHKSLDHFAAAGVTNARGLVVAHIGFSPGLVIGSTVPAEVRKQAQVLPLAVGSTALGEVVMVAGPTEAADASSMATWRTAGLLLAVLAAAGCALLWREGPRAAR